MVVFNRFSPNFLTIANLRAILRHMSATELSALGLTFVVAVRMSDLSFPGIASLGAMTAGWLVSQEYNLVLALALGIGVGVVFGAIGGSAVGFMRLPDITSTIAIGSISLSLSYLYSHGATLSDNFISGGLIEINDHRVFFLDEPVFLMVMMNVCAWLILDRSRFGRGFYATGENPRSAFFSGIQINLYFIGAFALSGALSCVASILRCAEAGQADVTAGAGFLLPAYASVYLGAALFGRVSVPATFASSAFISAMLNGFTLLSLPYYYSEAIISAILLFAVVAFDTQTENLLSQLLSGFGDPRNVK
jgi:ribose/xylose/arabinose/galactoside ABC-type transport system permease subunit